MAPRTYRGNCHCGDFVYTIAGVDEISEVIECNCSVCFKKGYLLFFPGDNAQFTLVKGTEADLASYTFGPATLSHKFCPKCSTGLFVCSEGKPLGQGIGLNVHAIQGVNTWKVTKKPYNGAAIGDAYVTSKYTGPEPPASIPNGKRYTGSCHCGSVKVAMENEEMEGHPTMRIVICNCSICERLGVVWVYPQTEQVELDAAPGAIGKYSFAYGMLEKLFCKHCGVCTSNVAADLNETQLKAMPQNYADYWARHRKLHPVNILTLDGVDMQKIKIQYLDG